MIDRQSETATQPKMRQGGSGLSGMLAFLEAFFSAPNDADIEMRIGSAEDRPREPLLLVMIDHPTMKPYTVGLTATEASGLADIAERAMHKFKDAPESKTLKNLIMALRFGADKLRTGALLS